MGGFEGIVAERFAEGWGIKCTSITALANMLLHQSFWGNTWYPSGPARQWRASPYSYETSWSLCKQGLGWWHIISHKLQFWKDFRKSSAVVLHSSALANVECLTHISGNADYSWESGQWTWDYEFIKCKIYSPAAKKYRFWHLLPWPILAMCKRNVTSPLD